MTTTVEVTNKRVFAIAGPAMLTNVTTPLFGVVATAVIGRLGQAHLLGGVAMASVVFDCLFWLFAFLRMGTVAFTAQALGADDKLEQRAVLIRALLVAAAIGSAIVVLQAPLASLIFGSIGGSEAVSAAARQYFFVRLWSAPFVLANYVLLGWLVGLARAKTAMAIQIAVNLFNMALMPTLVLGFDAGIIGAGIASVFAEGLGLVIGLAVAWHALGGYFGVTAAQVFERTSLLRMLTVNRDIMIRTAALIATYLFFSARGARSGDVTLAANAVLHNFTLIGAFFLDGLATAAEQLCGQAYGARDRVGFNAAVKRIVVWGFAFGIATSALFAIAGARLIDVMTINPDVRNTAREFLWLAALAPICGVMAFCYDGVYIGATWARDMRNLMVASLALYLGAWWLLQSLGNTGLWSALLVFFIARGVLQALRYPALARAPFRLS